MQMRRREVGLYHVVINHKPCMKWCHVRKSRDGINTNTKGHHVQADTARVDSWWF